jgi:NAD(P)-dependent dehydrogenase (short-subunit alcohol dehydrogenase family)
MTGGDTSGSHAGKVAVVTGAANGIGLATASQLWQQGARVIAVDIDSEALHRNCRDLSELQIVHDMAGDPADLAAALEEFGEVPQILVNNVGIAASRPFLELDDDVIEKVWRTNLLGPLSLTRSVVRMMIDFDLHGAVVFVSSLHSTSVRRSLDYSTSKAAITMAVRELAAELGPHRIRVNAVSPGDVHSDPVGNPIDDRNREIRQQVIPLDRLGSSSDIAQAILFLTDDVSSSYITGADLVVDGGLSTTNWITTRSLRWNASKTSAHNDRPFAGRLGARLSSRLRNDPS